MGMEYIQVGFSNPQKVKQIAIWENFNPGSIYQIYVIETNFRVGWSLYIHQESPGLILVFSMDLLS